jgi:uncharacterized protein YfiM (DUF2279 family)
VTTRFPRWQALVLASVCFGGPVGLAPRTARAADPASDPFARDKLLHASISAILAGGTYALATTQLTARYQALLVGAGVSLAIGAAKEGIDALGFGDPSWGDFAADAVGTALGLAVVYALDVAARGATREHPWLVEPLHTDRAARALGAAVVVAF